MMMTTKDHTGTHGSDVDVLFLNQGTNRASLQGCHFEGPLLLVLQTSGMATKG